jgi:hypothetical protein
MKFADEQAFISFALVRGTHQIKPLYAVLSKVKCNIGLDETLRWHGTLPEINITRCVLAAHYQLQRPHIGKERRRPGGRGRRNVKYGPSLSFRNEARNTCLLRLVPLSLCLPASRACYPTIKKLSLWYSFEVALYWKFSLEFKPRTEFPPYFLSTASLNVASNDRGIISVYSSYCLLDHNTEDLELDFNRHGSSKSRVSV